MAKQYDIVVLGATGYTGSRICEYLVNSMCSEYDMKIAFAGRSVFKLEKLKSDICAKYRVASNRIDVQICDIDDSASLVGMTKKSKILLNCVGPFILSGEKVVQSCIAGKCDYLDIAGEPLFIESSSLKYHQSAVENGVLIIHACGFDSIPAEFGVRFIVDEAKKRGVDIGMVEGHLSMHSQKKVVANITTLQSGILGFTNWSNLIRSRNKLDSSRWSTPVQRLIPKISLNRRPFFCKETNKWAVLFPGADAAVVRSTQRSLAANGYSEPLPWYVAYFSFKKLRSLITAIKVSIVFLILMKFSRGRKLLLQFPEFFSSGFVSRHGPSEEHLKSTTFVLDFLGFSLEKKQYPDRNVAIKARISGPEPGYVATPILIGEAAQFLGKNRSNLEIKGGVYTPGAVLYSEVFLAILRNKGLAFEIVHD